MLALMMQAIRKLEMMDIPDPIPTKGEVVVEVAVAGICGSDFHSARDGGLMRTPPIVMGHEFSGMVNGRRVAVDPMITCGVCSSCAQNLDNFCKERTIIGITRQGGFAERVAVPESALVDLPDHVSFEAGAMIEPLAVALHAFKLREPTKDSRVAILGAGCIGLMTTYLCSAITDNLLVVDLDPKRLEMAKTMGATAIGTNLEGEFDIIFDCAGTKVTHAKSISHLKPNCTAVWVGNENPDSAFDAQAFVRSQKSVIGSAAFTHHDFKEAANRIDERIINWTTIKSLNEGAQAMYELMEPIPGNPIKVLLRP